MARTPDFDSGNVGSSPASAAMNATELVKAGQRLYGERGWQSKMAAALNVDTSTIRRWMYADAVPGPAAAALQCFLREKGGEGEFDPYKD